MRREKVLSDSACDQVTEASASFDLYDDFELAPMEKARPSKGAHEAPPDPAPQSNLDDSMMTSH
jgi:hypothetical protein